MTALDEPAIASSTRIVHGTCHHDCPDSCGWHVTVSDGVAVQLRGNPAHPYSAGELCPKVNRFVDRVYSPDRILHPMRRTGPKGSGEFEQITWDEALREIRDRLADVIARHGAEAVMPYSDAGNQSLVSMGFTERFWNRLGATRLVRALCGPTVGAGVKMTNGTTKGLDPQELRHSKLIILWGTNTRLTNRHLWPTIEAARLHGAQVIVIDPIRTVTAEAADWFVQPLPGTDIALMLGMMHVMVRDDLVDLEWIAEHTVGFDDLVEHVAAWTPERAAEACGLDPSDVERLAEQYGTIRPAAIRTLVGAEHHENGAMFFRTMACLPALVGAWRDRGGGFARSIGVWSDELVDDDALTRPDLLAGRTPRWLNMSRLGDVLTDETLDPPVHAMVVWNANPMVVTPNAEAIRTGMSRADLFTVVHDQFMTDTARYADIVLPATTQIEATDVVPAWGHLYLGWNEQAIEPVGEAVNNSELHRRLAAVMGFTDAALFDDDLTVIRESLPSVDIDALRADGFVRVPYPEDGRPFGDGVFPTASGRVELSSPALQQMGHPALPTFIPPRESLGGDPSLTALYPFALLTPKQHARFLNSSYSHLPKHGPLEGGPFVELSPVDAERLGITDGESVRVHNARASLELPVRISTRLRERVVAIPFGWWGEHHVDGKVANALTNDTLTDWGGGVAYSDTLVAIERVNTG